MKSPKSLFPALGVAVAFGLLSPAALVAADKNVRSIVNRTTSSYTLTLTGAQMGSAEVTGPKLASPAILKKAGDKVKIQGNSTYTITFVRDKKGHELDMNLASDSKTAPKASFHVGSKMFEPCVEVTKVTINDQKEEKSGDQISSRGLYFLALTKAREKVIMIDTH